MPPESSSQSPALSQKHVFCHTAHKYLIKFYFHDTLNLKKIKQCNFHYVAMPMMTSQILKSLDFTETQISRYLDNET